MLNLHDYISISFFFFGSYNNIYNETLIYFTLRYAGFGCKVRVIHKMYRLLERFIVHTCIYNLIWTN